MTQVSGKIGKHHGGINDGSWTIKVCYRLEEEILLAVQLDRHDVPEKMWVNLVYKILCTQC